MDIRGRGGGVESAQPRCTQAGQFSPEATATGRKKGADIVQNRLILLQPARICVVWTTMTGFTAFLLENRLPLNRFLRPTSVGVAKRGARHLPTKMIQVGHQRIQLGGAPGLGGAQGVAAARPVLLRQKSSPKLVETDVILKILQLVEIGGPVEGTRRGHRVERQCVAQPLPSIGKVPGTMV